MRRYLVLGLLLLGSVVKGQELCNVTVVDDAQVLNPVQGGQIADAAIPLVNQGADVRVRTVGPTDNLDIMEKGWERECASWQGANGGRKNTLIVLMASPVSHKLGIYYGSAWKSALDGHWNRIKTDYMVPKFRDKDWAGGFVATETQLAARLMAAKDETLHPAVSTTVNQASDLTGLWRVFLFVVGIVGLGLLGWAVFYLINRKRREIEGLQAAQQRAVIARNALVDKINRYKEEVSALTQVKYDLAVENFARLMGSERTNPDTPNLSVEQYDDIADLYAGVTRDLNAVFRPITTPFVPRGVSPTEQANAPSRPPSKPHKRHPAENVANDPEYAARTGSGQGNSVGGGNIFAPVIINTEETYERPSRREVEETPAPEPPSYESHSDDSGGGSSSWSSDSGSSSSSDSGGSSDFGGGGGDSGGGGSSDF